MSDQQTLYRRACYKWYCSRLLWHHTQKGDLSRYCWQAWVYQHSGNRSLIHQLTVIGICADPDFFPPLVAQSFFHAWTRLCSLCRHAIALMNVHSDLLSITSSSAKIPSCSRIFTIFIRFSFSFLSRVWEWECLMLCHFLYIVHSFSLLRSTVQVVSFFQANVGFKTTRSVAIISLRFAYNVADWFHCHFC